jgi:hypothetical protein
MRDSCNVSYMYLQVRHYHCVLCKMGERMGVSKHNCHRTVFIGLTMTTCFGRALPPSGHKLVYKERGGNIYMRWGLLRGSACS